LGRKTSHGPHLGSDEIGEAGGEGQVRNGVERRDLAQTLPSMGASCCTVGVRRDGDSKSVVGSGSTPVGGWKWRVVWNVVCRYSYTAWRIFVVRKVNRLRNEEQVLWVEDVGDKKYSFLAGTREHRDHFPDVQYGFSRTSLDVRVQPG